uniref:Uncharacterized protein n=1 Tax=Setaria digitata TaxID=48799 RepID=A0A915PVU1_9BILA
MDFRNRDNCCELDFGYDYLPHADGGGDSGVGCDVAPPLSVLLHSVHKPREAQSLTAIRWR